MTSKMILRAAVAAAALVAAPQAQAVTFVLQNTAAGGAELGTNARRGFEIAAAYWSSVLTNTSTVTLNIGFSALGTGILGSTGSGTNIQFNSDYYAALAGNARSTVDASAIASLRPLTEGQFGVEAVNPLTNAFNATKNGYVDTATRLDNDGSQNDSTISMNSSLGKAMGFTTDALGRALAAVDGSVTFSTGFKFDFDPTDGIDADKFDFIGVAIHEIGHALGFRSGVDVFDAYTSPGATNLFAGTAANPALEGQTIATQLDLFRYSSAGQLDWTTQGQAYFSIDGGVSQFNGDSRMEMGAANGGRGRQASHFYDSAANVPQLGIMDPTSGYGQMQAITALDIAAFDTIGWTTAFDANLNKGYRFTTASAYAAFAANATPVVPEPATWAMMIAGFGLVGGAMRRRARVAVAA